MAKGSAWPGNLLDRADFGGPGECWTDPNTCRGYGQVTGPDGRSGRTHRIVWAEWVGPIQDGWHLHHLCQVRNCFHPDHLIPMDQRTHNLEHHPQWESCSAGHEFTEANTYIRKDNGERQCRRCHAIREQKRKAARGDGPATSQCSVCLLPFRTRSDGTIRAHFPDGYGRPHCPGTGEVPA